MRKVRNNVPQDSSYTAGEVGMGVQRRTPSPLLLLPPNITCNLTPEEEAELARKIAERGDEGATVKLYCCCLEDVFYYFYRRTRGDVAETEDLTADTLIRAIEGLRRRSWAGQPFRIWLFAIAKNVFLEWLRAKSKQTTPIDRSRSYPVVKQEQMDMCQGRCTDEPVLNWSPW